MILLDKARIFLRHHTARLRTEGKVQPKAAIFISAGFDASEWEGAGMQRHAVNVPTEFYARFTRDMVQLAQEEGTGCDGRVISVLEGGYSDRALCSGVLSHLSGLSRPSTSPTSKPAANDPLDLEQHMMSLSLQNGAHDSSTYDTQWWSAENLTALENKVNPPPPMAPGGKKYRLGQQPTYATPTESFAYKVHDPERFARSISGTMREAPASYVRAPTPPAPVIDWVVATQELVKLLIPQDRQTKSCTPEELAAPKKVVVVPSAAEKEQAERPRQLRTRNKPSYRENVDDTSRADRRRTIGDLPLAAEPAPVAAPTGARRSSRRSSMASTMSSGPAEAADDVPPVPPIMTTTNGMQPPPVPAAVTFDAPVKKTRAPPKLKSTTIPASAPVSPVASFKRQPAPQHRQAAAPAASAQSPTARSAAPLPNAMSPGSEMDALTRGLKKVTLKLGTREDHDRKMKEKLDADRRARALKGAETRRINKAAREAELSKSRLTPAQKGKLGPNASENIQSKPAAAVQGTTPGVSSAAPFHQPGSTDLTYVPVPPPANSTRNNFAPGTMAPGNTEHIASIGQEHTPTASAGYTLPQALDGSQSPPLHIEPTFAAAPTEPHFTIPTYTASAPSAMAATAPAPAPAPQPPTTTTPPIPSQFAHSRQGSTSSIYRFVPVMDETKTPPSSRSSSRPSTSARGASFQPSPVGTSFGKPSPPDPAASTRDVAAERSLPVFSSTGVIPFAPPASAGAADVSAGDGRSQLQDVMSVDDNTTAGAYGWGVPDSQEQ